MSPKNQNLLPGPKKIRPVSSKQDEMKTEKDRPVSSKQDEVKTNMDLFDEEFDIFIRSVEAVINKIEEEHNKL